MPRTYGGEAAEDIEFRAGLVAPPGAATSALPAPASIPAGSPLGVRGYRGGGGGTAAGPAAAGGGGGILGLTGGQFGLAALSGVASFLGGYQRNPGLLQISRNMTGALRHDIQQKQAQSIQARRQQAYSGIDLLDPDSVDKAAQRLMDSGFVDDAIKMKAQSKQLKDFVQQDDSKILDIARPVIQDGLKKIQAYHSVKKTVAARQGDVSQLNASERLAITIQFAYSEMPTALSDTEYSRAAGSGDVSGALNRIRQLIGLPPGATPDDTIREMINRMEDSSKASSDLIEFLDKATPSISMKGLRRMIPPAGVSRPAGLKRDTILEDFKNEIQHTIE